MGKKKNVEERERKELRDYETEADSFLLSVFWWLEGHPCQASFDEMRINEERSFKDILVKPYTLKKDGTFSDDLIPLTPEQMSLRVSNTKKFLEYCGTVFPLIYEICCKTVLWRFGEVSAYTNRYRLLLKEFNEMLKDFTEDTNLKQLDLVEKRLQVFNRDGLISGKNEEQLRKEEEKEEMDNRIMDVLQRWALYEDSYPDYGNIPFIVRSWDDAYEVTTSYRELRKTLPQRNIAIKENDYENIWGQGINEYVYELFTECEESYPYIHKYYEDMFDGNRLKNEAHSKQKEALSAILSSDLEIKEVTLELIEKRFRSIYNEVLGIQEERKIETLSQKKEHKQPEKAKKMLKKGEKIEIIFYTPSDWRYRLSILGSKERLLQIKGKNRSYLLCIASSFEKRDDQEGYNTISCIFPNRQNTANGMDYRLKEKLRELIEYDVSEHPYKWVKGKKKYILNTIVFRDGNELRDHELYNDAINKDTVV